MKFDSTQQLIESFRRGEMVVLVDDDDDRLGGVLLAPAEAITAEKINFMVRQARGLVCLGLTAGRCAQLQLPPMVGGSAGPAASRFTVSIEAAEGISTGISAADRAHTIRVAVARAAQARDVVQPGHVFPLRAEPGGVLKRAGHTEGGCDLARLAGHEPAAVMVDVLNGDGTLATGEALFAFARRHELRVGTIAELIQFRLRHETTVQHIREGDVQTAWGSFRLHAFRDVDDARVHRVDRRAGDAALVQRQRAQDVVLVGEQDEQEDFVVGRRELVYGEAREVLARRQLRLAAPPVP